MEKKKKETKYYWQPELATSIIYWSFTFASFFLGIIGFFETKKINIFSVISLLLFIVLLSISFLRYIKLNETEIEIHAIFNTNHKKLSFVNIEYILIGQHGLSFETAEGNFTCLMRKKTKQKLLLALQQQTSLQAIIKGK